MPSPLESTEAQSFRGLALAYCEVIDGRSSVPAAELVKAIHLILPALYAAAAALPEVEPDTDTDAPRVDQNPTLAVELGRLVGTWDLYSLMFDPYAGEEPVKASLGGDLAEIYEDLRGGLHHEKLAGEANANDVLWQWRFDFVSHWSRHAAGALSALNATLFTHYADELPDSFDRP